MRRPLATPCQTPGIALVRTEITDGVATVTLTDPERRNALTLPMVTEIVDAFDALEGDPAVGAVVVTGEAPAFCAGADLSHLSSSAGGARRPASARSTRASCASGAHRSPRWPRSTAPPWVPG